MPTVTVEGMACAHCEPTVEEALRGDTDVTVDRDAERADVEGEADVGALVSAVEEAGYEAHA